MYIKGKIIFESGIHRSHRIGPGAYRKFLEMITSDSYFPFLGFTFMVLNNAFVFHLGFKFEDKMHKSKNNENKLVSNSWIWR